MAHHIEDQVEEGPPVAEDPVERMNIFIHAAVVKARLGDVVGARKSITEAEKVMPDITAPFHLLRALVDLAVAWAKLGEITNALAFSTKLTQYPSYMTSALNGIASVQAKAGDFAGAQATFVQAKAKANDTTPLNFRTCLLIKIALCQAESGDHERAKITISEAEIELKDVDDPYEKAKISRRLALAKAKVGDFAGAQECITQAKTAANRILTTMQIPATLKEIAIAQAESGDFGGAIATIPDIAGSVNKANAWLGIARAQAKAGDFAGARESIAQAKTFMVVFESTFTETEFLNELAPIQAELGDFAGARESITQAKALGWSHIELTSSSEHVLEFEMNATACLAVAQAKFGFFDDAKATAADTEGPWNIATALLGIGGSKAIIPPDGSFFQRIIRPRLSPGSTIRLDHKFQVES
ncbi:MAG: hypothetical protein KR126chlam2_00996 [Chlamydiae bacterium]|nr:hypothetical protein [Chlamydiota bacterium]